MATDLIGQARPASHAGLQAALPLIDITPGAYFRWKVIIGRVIATLLLVPALPVIGLLVIAVRLTSPGPGIFRQVRVGLQGQIFLMYKIRTMVSDAERQSGPTWTSGEDPRITRLGRVLRKLHLDELPQLFNVIRGEMSLIGPRPERPEFIAVLTNGIPGYINRLAVRPGVTGLAQVNLPPDTDLQSVRRKLALDLEYIRTATPALDLRLLLYTVARLLGLPCQFAVRLVRLGRPSGQHEQTVEESMSVTLSKVKELAKAKPEASIAPRTEEQRAFDPSRDTVVNSIHDTLPDLRTLEQKLPGKKDQAKQPADAENNGHCKSGRDTAGAGRDAQRPAAISSTAAGRQKA